MVFFPPLPGCQPDGSLARTLPLAILAKVEKQPLPKRRDARRAREEQLAEVSARVVSRKITIPLLSRDGAFKKARYSMARFRNGSS